MRKTKKLAWGAGGWVFRQAQDRWVILVSIAWIRYILLNAPNNRLFPISVPPWGNSFYIRLRFIAVLA